MSSRKVRRVKRQPQQELLEPTLEIEARPVEPAPSPMWRKREAGEEELRREYAYVMSDLRRLAIIAAAMFALLVILGIVL
jgi:hypothetical protein